jgi:hypothetical protein
MVTLPVKPFRTSTATGYVALCPCRTVAELDELERSL